MTPLDDELRRTLSERASLVAPSADPLAGVEARASRIRRRRMAAAVAGAAAAVAAVALAVPSLVSDDSATKPPQFATSTPTARSGPADLSEWEYRGNDIPAATLEAYRAAWNVRHPGFSSFVPLFGQVYEPSAQQEVVFVTTGPDGRRVGVVRSTERDPEFVYDEPLGTLRELAFVLPGDEVARILVVAPPDTEAITYRDSLDVPATMLTALAPGVATGPVGAERSGALVGVTRADQGIDEFAPFDSTHVPDNLVRWELRGTDAVSPSTLDLRTRFAQAFGRSDVDHTNYSPLFVGDTNSGVHYTMGQAWFSGADKAYSVSYATGGTTGPAFFLGKVTPSDPWGLAFLFGDLPGTTTDLLIVVPRPMIGEISYSPDASSPFQAVANGRSDLNGIAFIDRAKDATNDRLEALEGDGIHVLYRGSVTPLLCGLKDCG